MKAVVQRVKRASVRVDGQTIGQIERGLLVLLGIGKDDAEADADWMINKLLNLRIFPDKTDKMNRSVTDIAGGLLIVSQFTLYGDVRKGTRPSFSTAMPPAEAEQFYRRFMEKLRAATTLPVAAGRFAAMMDVELINDGPVTIVLESPVVERASRPFVFEPQPQRTGETPVLLFQPFDPQTPAAVHERNLPHWQQPDCTYFITFRLADSLPQQKLKQWVAEREDWLKQHPPPHNETLRKEYQERFGDRLEQWLDAGYGECWLRQSDVSAIVEEAFRHFDGKRYQLGAFVIMPNHVHALVTPASTHDVAQIVHSWKSYTAHEISRVLNRTGKVWQDEYFDHIVRTPQALAQFEEYIRRNPENAGLGGDVCRAWVPSGTGVPPVQSTKGNERPGRPFH